MEDSVSCGNTASPTIPSIDTTNTTIQVKPFDTDTVNKITTDPVQRNAIELPANTIISSNASDILASAVSKMNSPIITDVTAACNISTSIGASAPPIPTTTKKIGRWTVLINGVYYQQREPNLKNHITFRCIAQKDVGDDKKWMEKKNKNIKDKHPVRCNGKFELTGWSTDPEPHFLNFSMQHDCHGKFPSIDQIEQFFEKVKNGDGIINQRKCDKSNAEYAKMLRKFIEVSSSKRTRRPNSRHFHTKNTNDFKGL